MRVINYTILRGWSSISVQPIVKGFCLKSSYGRWWCWKLHELVNIPLIQPDAILKFRMQKKCFTLIKDGTQFWKYGAMKPYVHLLRTNHILELFACISKCISLKPMKIDTRLEIISFNFFSSWICEETTDIASDNISNTWSWDIGLGIYGYTFRYLSSWFL